MGFAAGMQAGSAMAQRGIDIYEKAKLRQDLAQVYAKPETSQGYTAQDAQRLEELANTGAYDIVPQYAPSEDPQKQGVFTGYRAVPKAGLDLQGDVPADGAYINVAPRQVQDYGGQRVAGQFDPAQLRGLQAREAARVVGASGDFRGAAALEAQAAAMEAQAEERAFQAKYRPLQLQSMEGQIAGQGQQQKLTGIQISDAERKQRLQTDLDTGLGEINKQTFEKPEQRTEAILKLYEATLGPAAAEELRSKYSKNELDQISLQAKKFDEGFRQSRAKGVIPALEWFDEQNTSFKLERDPKNPFRVIQVNTDGSRSVFADAKNENELGMIIDAKAKPGGFLELAKFDLDVQSKNALINYYDAMAKKAKSEGGAAANQLTGVQVGYSRDENGKPIQVMSGLRFNRKTGALESVQVKLDQNVVPASALDPKKIADQAEALVGQPIDPTNKKSKDVHTFATAQQAVVDQIFNQYLGTGKPAGGLDLSPAAIAQRMLEGQKPAAPATSAPATVRPPTNLGIDPNRPQSNLSPVSGLPRGEPASGPNLVKAVTEGLDAGQARYVKYLESKIANNQPLTADEKIRARRFGLQ